MYAMSASSMLPPSWASATTPPIAASPPGSNATNNNFCRQRLRQERKQWKRDHPVGFLAKPRTNTDGSVDLMTWDCKIPGKENVCL